MWNFLTVTTLDKYIIRKFLATFFFSLLICTLISDAIDFSDKVQSFIEKPCTFKNITVDYYIGFMGYISGLLLPMYTLIAVVFFTSRLAFNAEILSIFNAGVSFRRLMKPYLMGAGIIAVIHLTLNHFIIPHFNKSRLWFEHTFVWTDQERGRTSNVHFLLSPDTKAYIRGYNKSTKTVNGLRLEHFTGSKIDHILDAESAIWKGDPNLWTISNFSIRTFDGLREKYTWQPHPVDTTLDLTPRDFIFYENQNQEMTTPELNEAINRDRGRGLTQTKGYEIEKDRRTADAFTNIIVTIIGLAVAGRKVRGGMGLHLAVGIGIGAIFILLSKFAVSFASNGSVPVMVGMWIPNIVFSLIALELVRRAQK
jgi:lipopolysaccharide export system permease protein